MVIVSPAEKLLFEELKHATLPITQGQLAQRLHLSTRTIQRLLNSLHKQGHISTTIERGRSGGIVEVK